MCRRAGWLVALISLPLAFDEPSRKPPATAPEFKLVVGFYGSGPDPVGIGEIVSRQGRIYHFTSELNEFLVIDPKNRRVELLDLKRRVQASIPLEKVDDAVASMKKRLLAVVKALEAKEDRAGRVSARKTRELIEPAFRAEFDEKSGVLKLSNGSIEVKAVGVSDPDSARLLTVADAIDTLARLNAIRDPDAIPPFGRLEAVAELARRRKLRPTEMSYIYRLNGPPEKYRWTYRLEPTLTDRDYIGLARLDRFRAEAKSIPLADFEAHAGH